MDAVDNSAAAADITVYPDACATGHHNRRTDKGIVANLCIMMYYRIG